MNTALSVFNNSLDVEERLTDLDKLSRVSVIFQIPTMVLSFGFIIRIIGIITNYVL